MNGAFVIFRTPPDMKQVVSSMVPNHLEKWDTVTLLAGAIGSRGTMVDSALPEGVFKVVIGQRVTLPNQP
jgi:hypothetical protein